MPMFTVLIPAYNRAHLLAETLASVRAQTLTDYEVLVIDDASTEDMTSVVAASGLDVTLITHSTNRGSSATRNTGLSSASGAYVALLDSDDLWFPWTLDTYARAIHECGAPAMVSGPPGLTFQTQAPSPTADAVSFRHYPSYFEYMRQTGDCGWLLTSGTAYRTDVLRKVGFRESYRCCEDDDAHLRLGPAPGFVRIQSPVNVAYRVTPGSNSKSLIRMAAATSLMIAEERARPRDRHCRDRAFFISQKARHLARSCARAGRVDLAKQLYFETLPWNLRLGRWKFLLGLPAEAALAWLRVFRTSGNPGTIQPAT
jgi:GT2 family glycosyltransferase